ncbi:MAG: nicotinate phosphoribosyltransferase [Tissierellia bacterium]|nr:nicotinate phosphoribosyltransferase [Tissierellia bacterium]
MKINWRNPENYTMLADYYEFTMANGYLESGMADKIAYFDMFFRSIPDGGGFAIMAGVEQLINYLQNLKFTDEDIEFFRSKKIFGEDFLEYLRNFKFECDVWAVREGTPIFPQEPIITVRGPVIQAQMIETMVLLTINHQSLIATKANRIVRAAQGRSVMEFGSRRAQGSEAAILGARAAFIGGAVGTANTIVDRDFGVPALGTMAHSWVQLYPSEYEAFKVYAETYPSDCTLLIDTYNTIQEGLPNAIKVFNEVILPKGFRPKGVRIDSGDLSYLTKRARVILDEAGFPDVKIVASGGLDEHVILNLITQGAKIDSFGVGERLITASSQPVFGGVYKLTTVEEDGELVPKIKISENVEKITTPCFKQVYRFFDKDTDMAIADLVTLHDEAEPDGTPYEIFHPVHIWKRKTITNYYVKRLQEPIFVKGECVYESPKIRAIRDYCKSETDKLWEEVKRFENPHIYIVDLSKDLWEVKNNLLAEHK